jgi:hypothetical protein
MVWTLLRLVTLLGPYLAGNNDNYFPLIAWRAVVLTYLTYAIYGDRLLGSGSFALPAFGSDPTAPAADEPLPAKRARRAPAKLDADDAAAAVDDDSSAAPSSASRSKSPARRTPARATPARRTASPARR